MWKAYKIYVFQNRNSPCKTEVKIEKNCKGGILADLGGIWKVIGEILPLQKSKEKPRKNHEKVRKTMEKTLKHVFFFIFSVIWPPSIFHYVFQSCLG